MEKRGQMSWFVYACALCLGYSGCVASITVMFRMSSKEYFLLAAFCVVASLLAVYLPLKILANRFCWRPECIGERKKKIYTSVVTVLILGTVVTRCLFFMPAGALAVSDRTSLWLNMALQLLSVVFLVPAVSMLSGCFCGLAAGLTVPAGPSLSSSIYMKEPQSFYLFLFSFILFFNVLLLKSKKRSFYCIRIAAAAVLCGVALVFSGQMVHVILICVVFIFLTFREKKISHIFLYLAVAMISFLVCLTAAAAGDGVSAEIWREVLDMLQQWLSFLTSRETDALLHSASVVDYCIVLPFYLLAFFGLLEMKNGRECGVKVWILPLMFQTVLDMISKAPLQEQGMRLVLLGVFAGYGITETMHAKEGVEMKWKKKAAARSEETCEKEQKASMTFSEGSQVSDGGQSSVSLQAAEKVPPKPGEYLANPLPVPKRHAKKEMNYGFEPAPDQMFYDIPVDENDDFELK